MVSKTKLAVVGGGAAGLMAAIVAARNGAQVTVLERMSRVGKKILATGNGRCNLTNTDMDICHFHGQNPRFAYTALTGFGNMETLVFFEELGIAHRIEATGKVYPASNQASSVLDVMRYELDELGVETVCDFDVTEIKPLDGGFNIQALDGRTLPADAVILAAGGKASPQLGSNGSGYALAAALGHQVVEPFPALVQLKCAKPFLKHLRGIKFEGRAELVVQDKVRAAAEGEILFTDYGVSGPPIFDLSRLAGEHLQRQDDVHLKLVLVPDLSRAELEDLLIKRFGANPRKTLAFSFVGFLSKRLAQVVLDEAGIEDSSRKVGTLTAAERGRIVDLLQDWRFRVTGTMPWSAAQVTAGGLDVKQINPRTMESKLVPGLYFAGEIIDIDGDCGGYNLQWAWSSGFVAGQNAAKSVVGSQSSVVRST